jgi:predicted nucleic acid-binding protein
MNRWYVDTSVLLRVIKEGSPASSNWFSTSLSAGDRMISSLFLDVEARHILRNANLSERPLDDYLGDILLLSVDDELMAEAASLRVPIRGADSIHLASALRVGPENIWLATHDQQMADAAAVLGITTYDPVTDDPSGKTAAQAPP